jgi:putative transcriptional regulator
MSMFKENRLELKQGRLLVAEPFMNDNYFRRAVVVIAELNDKGTVGFILNKPVEMFVHEVIPDFPLTEHRIHFGGPVQRDQLFYIHTLGDKIANSIPIGPGLWWLGDFEQVRMMVEKREIGQKEIRFFIGYSGWEAGQIEGEMEKKSWFVSKINRDLVFDVDSKNLWGNAVKSLGKEFEHMRNFPEDPALN